MAAAPPLTGLKVLEFAGLAPGPFAGMLLADAGASVLRIDRPASETGGRPTEDLLARHKSSIAVDLKDPQGVALLSVLSRTADVLIDPFRPGVLERLGLGPEVLCDANPRLIYARLTGFRRDGKYAAMAGHDINYLAVNGVLSLLGRKNEKPTPPWNILADFAGGGATLVHGILLALLSRSATGKGQVVEASMVDGASYLATFPRVALKTSLGDQPRGENLLDSGCPFYDTYETADGKYMAVGALEPQFFHQLVKGLRLDHQDWEARRYERETWPHMRAAFERKFKSRTRHEWEQIFDGTDACCTPVLDYRELEGNTEREGDQRPMVALRNTPCFAIDGRTKRQSYGLGSGVTGGGYEASLLDPGHGGEETLKHWLGWTKGAEYDIRRGAFVSRGKSKL